MPLSTESKSKLILLLGLPIEELVSIGFNEKLSKLELFENGALVESFEALIEQATLLEQSLNTSGDSFNMIKADVVEWSGGKGLGVMSELNRMKNKIRMILKLDLAENLASATFLKSRSILDGLS